MVIVEADANDKEGAKDQVELSLSTSSDEDTPAPTKVPRLLAKYNRHRNKSGSKTDRDTTRRQLVRYFEEVQDLPGEVCALQFWKEVSKKLPTLYKLAYRVLSVPASSAPVERIFSRGGIIMRPHRARLSSDMLSMLMFLKCKENII